MKPTKDENLVVDFKKCYKIIEQLKACTDDEKLAIYETMQDLSRPVEKKAATPKVASGDGLINTKEVGRLHGLMWSLDEIEQLTGLIKSGHRPCDAGRIMFDKYKRARSLNTYQSRASEIKSSLERNR